MDPRTAARETSSGLERALGNHLRAVVLYGSVARGEFIQGVSDINLLVLLDDIDTSALLSAAPAVARGAERHVNPLILEWQDRIRAADVFGIELLDMEDAHEVLVGVHPFADVVVPRPALRLQAERELRSKLLALHAGMLHTAADGVALGGLLMAALPSFATYLRAVLRLAREPVPATASGVIRHACGHIGADPAGLLAAEQQRRTAAPWRLVPTDPIVEILPRGL